MVASTMSAFIALLLDGQVTSSHDWEQHCRLVCVMYRWAVAVGVNAAKRTWTTVTLVKYKQQLHKLEMLKTKPLRAGIVPECLPGCHTVSGRRSGGNV
jgi:hypothetical protein